MYTQEELKAISAKKIKALNFNLMFLFSLLAIFSLFFGLFSGAFIALPSLDLWMAYAGTAIAIPCILMMIRSDLRAKRFYSGEFLTMWPKI